MADIFSTFLHFRSLTANYNSPLFLPPKQHFSSALHSHNSRFSRTRRRPPHLLLLLKPSPFAASASEIVVISTHEHSDGSVLFRFGDPSEIRQNVEMEESKIVKEEIEEEDESDVTASSLTEAGDGAHSVVSSSNTLIAVEGERLFFEKSLTATVDIEVPISISNNKMGVISRPDSETELIENVEGSVSSPDLEIKQIENVDGDLTSNKETEGVSRPDLDIKLIENVDGPNEDKEVTSNEEMEGVSSPDLEIKQIENVDGLNEEDKSVTLDEEMGGVSSEDLEIKQIENLEGDLTSKRETEGVTSPDLEMKLIENVDGLNEEDEDLISNKEVGGISSTNLEIKQIENVEGELTSNEEIGGVSSPDFDNKLIESVDGPNEDKDVTSNEEVGGVSGPDIEIKQIENVDGLNEEDKNVTLDEETGGVSSLALDIKQIENVEGLNEEDKDLTSDKGIGSVSSPDLEIKQIENVEDLNDEDKDLSAVEASIPDGSSLIENTTVEVSYDESLEETDNVTCTSNETESSSIPGVVVGHQTANVEESPNEDADSPADVYVSILDQSSEVVDNITTVASLEKESDDISPADIDADLTGKLGESLNEECEESPVDDSIVDKISEVENGISAVVLLEKETDGNSSASDIEIEQTGNVEEGSSEEYEDSLVDKRSEILNNTTAALSENEAAEITSPPYEDSLVDASEVEHGISEVVLLEKETDGNTSASDVEIEPTGNVEEGINEEFEDFPMDKRSEVLNNTTAALLEKEAADITSASFEDSVVDASVLNESSEVENGISAVVLVDEETEGNTSTSDVGREPTENVEEGIIEDVEEPPVDTGSEGLNDTIEALSEKETVDITATDIDVEHTSNGEQGVDEILEEPNSVETADAIASVALKIDPVVPISALDTDAAIITNVVPINELQNEEIHNEKVGDDSESYDDDLVSSSSDSEPSLSFYKETEVPNLQAEMNSLATEVSSETDVDSIEAVEMQNVLSNDNESDTYGGEDDSPTMELAMTRSIGSEEQASGCESRIQNETVGYVSEKDVAQLLTVSSQLEADSMLEEEIGTETVEESKEDDESQNQAVGADLAEALVHKTTAPEFADYTISSQEILTTDFILSSGAALLPHPSKVERTRILLLIRHGSELQMVLVSGHSKEPFREFMLRSS